MAALTMARDTAEIAQGAKYLSLPVKGKTTIYQGSLVVLDAEGYAIPGKKAAGLTAAGRSLHWLQEPPPPGWWFVWMRAA